MYIKFCGTFITDETFDLKKDKQKRERKKYANKKEE